MGNNSVEIGVALSTTTFIAFFSQFILGYISDAIKSNKLVFIFGLGITLCVSVLFFRTNPLISMLAFAACLGLFYAPMTTILDVWVLMSVSPDSKYDFAFIRSWCALGAGVFSVVYCWLLDKLGFGITLWFTIPIMLATIIMAMGMKNTAAQNSQVEKKIKEKISLSVLAAIFKNSRYTITIISYAFVGIASSAEIMMLPLRIKLSGGTTFYSGVSIFILMISQWLTLMFYKKVQRRISVSTLFMLGNLLYFVYFLCQATAFTPLMIAIVTIGNGVSYGIYFPSLRQILFDSSHKEVRTFAQSVSDAIGLGICGAIGGVVGGKFVSYSSGRVLMLICAGFTAMAIALVVADKIRRSKTA